MKTLLNLRLHPIVILFTSVAFWFIVWLAGYAVLMIYFIHKCTHGDKVVRVDEGAYAVILLKVNGRIYRCKVKRFIKPLNPLVKR